MGAEIERIVLEFVHAAFGESMDIDTMAALMADDFVWQLNVPLSPVISGRDAACAELERHNQMSTGMVAGTEIRTVVPDDHTVVVERVDVNTVFGKQVTFHVAAVFEVRGGTITSWREYWARATRLSSSVSNQRRCSSTSADELRAAERTLGSWEVSGYARVSHRDSCVRNRTVARVL